MHLAVAPIAAIGAHDDRRQALVHKPFGRGSLGAALPSGGSNGANCAAVRLLVRVICALSQLYLCRYGQAYPSLSPRVVNTLKSALEDDSKPITTKYGALMGTKACGGITLSCTHWWRRSDYNRRPHVHKIPKQRDCNVSCHPTHQITPPALQQHGSKARQSTPQLRGHARPKQLNGTHTDATQAAYPHHCNSTQL